MCRTKKSGLAEDILDIFFEFLPQELHVPLGSGFYPDILALADERQEVLGGNMFIFEIEECDGVLGYHAQDRAERVALAGEALNPIKIEVIKELGGRDAKGYRAMVAVQHAVPAFAHIDLDNVGLVGERALYRLDIVFAPVRLAAAMSYNPRPLPRFAR